MSLVEDIKDVYIGLIKTHVHSKRLSDGRSFTVESASVLGNNLVWVDGWMDE